MPQICGMGRRAEDFSALKNPMASARFEAANLGTRGQHDNPEAVIMMLIFPLIFIFKICFHRLLQVSYTCRWIICNKP
jgi:hypothetical protein